MNVLYLDFLLIINELWLADGLDGLPEPQHLRVENKIFYFDVGQNRRGVFMRISEVLALELCRFPRGTTNCIATQADEYPVKKLSFGHIMENFWPFSYIFQSCDSC